MFPLVNFGIIENKVKELISQNKNFLYFKFQTEVEYDIFINPNNSEGIFWAISIYSSITNSDIEKDLFSSIFEIVKEITIKERMSEFKKDLAIMSLHRNTLNAIYIDVYNSFEKERKKLREYQFDKNIDLNNFINYFQNFLKLMNIEGEILNINLNNN